MRYRVDELAARCGVSVDTVRFYQGKGLLPQPAREGRIAWYSDDHVDRLARIRDLKDKGFTLASIRRLLDGEVDAADAALAAALAGTLPGEDAAGPDDELLTLDDLARRTGVSPTLLAAVEREGLLVGRDVGGEARYTAADAGAVEAGLALLEAGLPLGELLDLARRHDEAMRAIAAHAVELFARFVRDPIRAAASDDDEAAERLVDAFRRMLPATATLVAHHFRRVLLAAAQERVEGEGLELDAGAGAASGAEVGATRDAGAAWHA
ncbi:MAG TPA: MerR family transcriptional regulator [Actinomycetota bacterium]|nr:MerR family transcriptional regulator [Actinomycetota bacterium]